VSAATGFHIGNVFVLAGVPMIMRAMLEAIEPLLPRGVKVESITVQADIGEGRIAAGLAQIQKDHPGAVIGSYPYYRENGFGVQLVARGRDGDAVEAAARAIETMLNRMGTKPLRL
jgi:molybdopterin-biosynthesis enzyme MoeA-like protein